MNKLNFQKIEKKWQKKWENAKIGNAKANKSKKKWFMIFAYITVSGYMHTGHMRGYSYTDVLCRYKRLKGYNVLFPVGSHATGNGAIAKAQKIKEKDKQWIDELKAEGASSKDIKKVSDPNGFVEFFNESYIREWKQFGFIADWDRFTCTIDPGYKKFIEWQFRKLNDLNLLIKKPYFATFCPDCGPVSVDPAEMDLLRGGDAEQQEFTLLKFKSDEIGKNTFLVAATLRPETIYGQTNLWVNPNINYLIIKIGKEKWIISKECKEKLSYQKKGIQTLDIISGQELIGKHAIAPGINRKIIILPATLCDPKVGTGIVTSVPSDAPYDWIALRDLQRNKNSAEIYGLDFNKIKRIKVIPIIQSKEWGYTPAVKIVNEMNIKNQEDPLLKEATQKIYSAGFHTGIMKKVAGKYAGMKVEEAKEKVKAELIKANKADIMYDLSKEVVCRCGKYIIIKKVPDQWFIKYSDKKLTKDSQKHSKEMNIKPEDYYKFLPEAIEWFQDRPCARLGKWMGTPLPFDNKFIIEAIADSTLYPIYYLVSKYVNNNKINPKQMNELFFDYIFLGKRTPERVSNKTGISIKLLREIKEEVNYWYPLDINLGGKEHKTVHFPPFIMNHIAILPKKYWPKGIIANGWIIGKNGTKFSKSKGNAELVPEIAKNYGVDSMRLYYSNISNPYVDIEFDRTSVISYKQKLQNIYKQFKQLQKIKGKKISNIDKWLESRFNSKIKKISKHMENFLLKEATDAIFFEIPNDLKMYIRRQGTNAKIIRKLLTSWTILMSPFTPHLAEELWENLEKKKLVSKAVWPVADEKKINLAIEESEGIVMSVLSDIRHIMKIAKITKPKRICLYTVPLDMKRFQEVEKFITKETNSKVYIYAVNDPKKYDPDLKSKKARPGKPGIYIE